MTTITETTTTTITKDDLKAWREADSAVYFLRIDNAEGARAGVRLNRDEKTDSRGWVRPEGRYTIEASGTLAHYADDRVTYPERNCSHLDWMRYDRSVSKTIGRMLRVGDELRLHFVGSNNSDNTRAVAHHRDECWLRVIRGKQHFDFLVGVYVGPNNTARMVGGY